MCEDMSAEPKKLPPSRNITAPKIVAKADISSNQSKIVDRYTSNNNNNACSRNFRDNGGGGGGGYSAKWDNRHSSSSNNSANWGRKGCFGAEKYRRGGQPNGGGGGRRTSEAAGVHEQASSGIEEDPGQQVVSKKSLSAAADLGSVFRPGSKKGVLTEYLSFSYESPVLKRSQFYRQFTYEEPNSSSSSYLRNVNSNVYARSYSSSTAYYNKEQYLQANCQFIMNDAYDYGPHIADPDLLVDWNCVEEIRFLDNESPSCPICLYPPIAAQITRCGHVFCWPCILHYLALSDKQWRRCPICYESIYKNQLKSVRSIKAERYTEDKQITLRLMRREKGSNLALPVSCWHEKHTGVGKINDNFGRFAKLLVTSTEEIRSGVIDRERAELQKQLAEEFEAPESCFIREALEVLQDREKTLHAAETFREMSGPVHTNRSPPLKSQVFHLAEGRKSVEIFTDAFNEISSTLKSTENPEQAPGASKKEEIRSISESSSGSGSNDSSVNKSNHDESMVATAGAASCTTGVDYANHPCTEKSYYFYQSDDGQPLFLHPLNVHCLVREYGALEHSPEIVSGVVTQIETFTMCPETRKRYRYLGHLPLCSVFSLVELRFADNVVSEDTVEHFADQFEKRRRFRIRKEKDAQRLQKQAERWERAMMLNAPNASKYPPAMSPDEIPISTFVQSAQSEIQAACLNPDVNNVDTTAIVAASSSSSSIVPGSPDDPQRSLSFAQMLRQGKPRLSAPAAIGQSAAASMTSSDSHGPTVDEEDGEYAPLALSHYRNEFGDALQAAFDSLKMTDDSEKPESILAEESNIGSKNNNKGKMKKKKKGKILFTL